MSIKDKILIKELQKQLKEKDRVIEFYRESDGRSDEEKKLLEELTDIKAKYDSMIEELKEKKREYENLVHEQMLITESFKQKVNEIKLGI